MKIFFFFYCLLFFFVFFFSSRRRHTRSKRDWSSDVCSSDLLLILQLLNVLYWLFIGCAPFYFFSLNFASRHKPIAKISCPNGLNHAAIPLQSCRSSATVVVTSICLNASENFPHLLRMAHDRRRLRPAYTGRWAVLLRLFGFFSSPEPRSGIEPHGDISGFFAGARAGSLRGSRGRLHH